MNDEDVKVAMDMCFGIILKSHPDEFENPTALCLLLLASIVYHSNWLKSTAAKGEAYPFQLITLLSHEKLLDNLRRKITTTKGRMTPTGIPPHIEQATLCRTILEKCNNIIDTFGALEEKINKIIENALEKSAHENGNLTKNKFLEMLTQMKGEIMTGVAEKNTAVLTEVKTTVTNCMKQYNHQFLASNNNNSFVDWSDNSTSKFF